MNSDIEPGRTDLQGLGVVLIVLNDFVNDSRVLKEALTLKTAGMDVSVCAMHEGDLPESEVVQGVKVRRLRLRSRSWSKKRLVQVLKYFEFIYRASKLFRRVDIAHCNDLNALPVGVVLKLLNGKIRILYDAHEFEIHRSASQSALSIKANYLLERFLIRFANAVTVTSKTNAEEYQQMYGIEMPHVVMNCTPLTNAVDRGTVFRDRFNLSDDTLIFLYQGALHEARGIRVMLDTFSQLDGQERVIVFMGFGLMASDVEDHARRYQTIFFHEPVAPEELYRFTAGADCGIIYMPNSCRNHDYALPNKLFEYMMAGIPTIATPLREVARTVNEHGVGFVSNGEDVASLLKLVKGITREDLTALEPSIQNARQQFTWENQEKTLLSAYQSMLE